MQNIAFSILILRPPNKGNIAKILLLTLNIPFVKYFLLTVASVFLLVFYSFAQKPVTDSVYTSVDSIAVEDSSSSAIDKPVNYNSEDSIKFVVGKRMVYMYGEGDVKYDDIDLVAEKIELDLDNSQIKAQGTYDSIGKAEGIPHFKQSSDEFDADTLIYNFKTKKGIVYGVVTEQEGGYLHSHKTKMQDNGEIHIKGGKYTTCDSKHPHFYIGMTKAKVIPEKQIITGPAYLVIADLPTPLAIPFGFFPNKKGRRSGIIIPTPGEDHNKGFYLRGGGFYLGLNDYFDITLKGDIYSLGTRRASLGTNYVKRYKYRGAFMFEYSSAVVDEERQGRTFNVGWNHSEDPTAHPNRSFSSSVNFSTPGYNKTNARTLNDYHETTTSSSINLTQKIPGTGIRMSISANHQMNNTDSTISLNLPSFDLTSGSLRPFKNVSKRSVLSPLKSFSAKYSYNALNYLPVTKMDSSFLSEETLNRFVAGMKHDVPLSLTWKVFKFFSISPSFNYSERWFFEKYKKKWVDSAFVNSAGKEMTGLEIVDTIPGFQRVYDYNTSVSINTKIYTIATYRNKYLKAIRHTLTPSVSFSLKPDFKKKYYRSYENGDGKTISYSMYNGGKYGVPSNTYQQNISFRLANNLHAKIRDEKDTVTGTKKIALLESFSVATSYNAAADSMKWSDITIRGNTTLFKKFAISFSYSLSPYSTKGRDSYLVQESADYLYSAPYGSRLWKIDNSQWSVSTGVKLGPVKKESDDEGGAAVYASSKYPDFSLPWNLNVSFSLSLPKRYYYDQFNEVDKVDSKITKSMRANGSVSLTKKWKINYSTGWDFEENKISTLQIDIFRDLHCWEMSFNWVPMGNMQYYEFMLRVKASMLQDLKLQKSDYPGRVF